MKATVFSDEKPDRKTQADVRRACQGVSSLREPLRVYLRGQSCSEELS